MSLYVNTVKADGLYVVDLPDAPSGYTLTYFVGTISIAATLSAAAGASASVVYPDLLTVNADTGSMSYPPDGTVVGSVPLSTPAVNVLSLLGVTNSIEQTWEDLQLIKLAGKSLKIKLRANGASGVTATAIGSIQFS